MNIYGFPVNGCFSTLMRIGCRRCPAMRACPGIPGLTGEKACRSSVPACTYFVHQRPDITIKQKFYPHLSNIKHGKTDILVVTYFLNCSIVKSGLKLPYSPFAPGRGWEKCPGQGPFRCQALRISFYDIVKKAVFNMVLCKKRKEETTWI